MSAGKVMACEGPWGGSWWRGFHVSEMLVMQWKGWPSGPWKSHLWSEPRGQVLPLVQTLPQGLRWT